jgi:hypothetical protein
MPLFVLENSERGSNKRRVALVYADNKQEAFEKLYSKFPNAIAVTEIVLKNINPDLSTCVIK